MDIIGKEIEIKHEPLEPDVEEDVSRIAVGSLIMC